MGDVKQQNSPLFLASAHAVESLKNPKKTKTENAPNKKNNSRQHHNPIDNQNNPTLV